MFLGLWLTRTEPSKRIAIAAGPALVLCLLGWCGPSAVARGISSIVVDAIDAVRAGRSVSHISQKSGEGLSPLLAHRDPASTVIFKSRMVAVFAPLDHASPTVVFGGIPRSVCAKILRSPLTLQAATTLMATALQVSSERDRRGSTIALAEPSSFDSFACVLADNKKPPESLAGLVDLFHAVIIPTNSEVVCHE